MSATTDTLAGLQTAVTDLIGRVTGKFDEYDQRVDNSIDTLMNDLGIANTGVYNVTTGDELKSVVASLFGKRFLKKVTINLADGTYDMGTSYIYLSLFNSSSRLLEIIGNETNPDAVVITSERTETIVLTDGFLSLKGVKLLNPNGRAIYATNYSTIVLNNINISSNLGIGIERSKCTFYGDINIKSTLTPLGVRYFSMLNYGTGLNLTLDASDTTNCLDVSHSFITLPDITVKGGYRGLNSFRSYIQLTSLNGEDLHGEFLRSSNSRVIMTNANLINSTLSGITFYNQVLSSVWISNINVENSNDHILIYASDKSFFGSNIVTASKVSRGISAVHNSTVRVGSLTLTDVSNYIIHNDSMSYINAIVHVSGAEQPDRFVKNETTAGVTYVSNSTFEDDITRFCEMRGGIVHAYNTGATADIPADTPHYLGLFRAN